MRLSELQQERLRRARSFADGELAPNATLVDQSDTTPAALLETVRREGLLGRALPAEWGGGGYDPVSHGVELAEVGRVSSTLRSLLTVHDMSTQAVLRFGTQAQKLELLPHLCSGEKLIAFALTEPESSSATQVLRSRAVREGRDLILTGVKTWVTFGAVADFFLVFADCEGRSVALVVERNTPGIEVLPIHDVLGTRGSMLASIRFHGVKVPNDRQIGADGAGIKFVASVALDQGRFSVAWGSVGILAACLHACVSYAKLRAQGDAKLGDHQLVKRQLADMLVEHSAARALCMRAACLRAERDPRSPMETSLAKYHASASAMRVAAAAVHLHGANGCSSDYPVSRYLRDATIMGIVEGTHEMHQLALGSYALREPNFLD